MVDSSRTSECTLVYCFNCCFRGQELTVLKNELPSSATKVSGNSLAVIWLEFGGADRWTSPTLPLQVVLFFSILHLLERAQTQTGIEQGKRWVWHATKLSSHNNCGHNKMPQTHITVAQLVFKCYLCVNHSVQILFSVACLTLQVLHNLPLACCLTSRPLSAVTLTCQLFYIKCLKHHQTLFKAF